MKKRILFINGHLNGGGVEKSLVDILKHLNYEEYEVDLLLLEELGDYEKEIPSDVNIRLVSLKNTYGSLMYCLARCIKSGDVFSLKMRLIMLAMKLFGPRCIWLARNLLTDNRHYNCVVGFRSGICTQIAAFAVSADKKIIWWHHGEFNVSVQKYSEVAGVCDTVVAVSQSCAEMLKKNIPILKSKLLVIPNMVDKQQLEQKCLQGTPYQKNTQNWVTVCRISQEKHVENVIYAAQKLMRAGFQFFWHIVGDGVLKAEMEQMAVEQGVQDYVLFEGSKVNPYPYIKYADLYVHPSYVESQGLTILEAMNLETPCVVTKSRGPCEFIQDGFNGILVEQSFEALADGIVHIIHNRDLYEKIKHNLACPFEFQPERVMYQVEKLLG